MQRQIEQTDLDFLSFILRSQPVTVQQLCNIVRVTATAIRQRLFRLEAMRWIEREAVHQSRGRPVHAYKLTTLGLKQLGDDYAQLAVLLWKEINAIEDATIRRQLLSRVQKALVEKLGSRISSTSPMSRVQELSHALADRGLVVEVDGSGLSQGSLPILREHSCPYHELATEDSGICELEQAVFAEVLGTPVALSACRLEGHRCCEFQVGVHEKSMNGTVVNDTALPV